MAIILKNSGLPKFKKGHPWVFRDNLRFSNEFSTGLHDLNDSEGHWLAKGLLNPKSKIAFRVLTQNPQHQETSVEDLLRQLVFQAIEERKVWIDKRYSCRLIHGESDHLSGLIVDAFFTSGDSSDLILVLQSQSAGMDSLQDHVVQTLSDWGNEQVQSRKVLSSFKMILKNDSSKRVRDGLEVEAAQVVSGEALEGPVSIRVGSGNHDELMVQMKADLSGGQKTGFFLDQSFNIDVTYELMARMNLKQVKLLDICSYVGQWGAKLSQGMKAKGIKIETTALDASEAALSMTRENVQANGGYCEAYRCDVFKQQWPVGEREFDVVVCDPPALIKNRKDLNVGKHGYVKLNTLALQRVKKDGLFVSCSCSGVLNRDDFREALEKAAQKAGRRVLWVAEGRQSPDHPIRDWFPEGEYLKCFVGRLLD